MKYFKVNLFFAMVVAILAISSSCSDEQYEVSVLKRNLDSQFNLAREKYDKFINSMIFDEEGSLIGAIYDKIQKALNDKTSNGFWRNFNSSIQNKNHLQYRKRLDHPSEEESPVVLEGQEPKRGGCKTNPKWICVIRDY